MPVAAKRPQRASSSTLQGRVFMPNHVDDPFRCVDDILKEHGKEVASDYRRYACRSDFGKSCHGLVSRRPRLRLFTARTRTCRRPMRRILSWRHRLYHRSRHVWPVRFRDRYGKGNTSSKAFEPTAASIRSGTQDNVALQGVVVELDDKTGKAREIRRLASSIGKRND